LLAQYHCLGFHGPVGENAEYVATDRQHRELAATIFAAAAWKMAVRDQFIGWPAPAQTRHLAGIANQQRFLILP
jgi:hypothetical protein